MFPKPATVFTRILSLVLPAFLLSLPFEISADAFVRFGSISGGATESAHLNWSEFDSSSLFLYRIKGSAALQLTRLQLRKPLDSSSPTLAKTTALGEVLKTVKIDYSRSSGELGGKVFFQLTLEDARIISLSVAGDSGELNEVMDVEFGKISWDFTRLDAATGNPTPIGAFWDAVKNLGGDFNSTAFQVYGLSLESGEMKLAWPAQQGQKFRVLGSSKVEGPYQMLREITAEKTGGVEVSLPSSAAAFFFNVERLP